MKPIQSAYFISDAHLGAGTKEEESAKTQRILTFFDRCIQPDVKLFILGDLYDFWFEYKTVIPRAGIQVTAKLVELVRQGIPITYVGGNHDFWLQGQFLKDMGIEYRDGLVELKLGEKSFLLAHGDSLWPLSFGQRIVNSIFRSKTNIRLYRWVHPDAGLAFGNFISELSRKKSAKKEFNSHKDYIRFAEEQFNRGIDNVIIGHTHRPFYKKYKDNTFINLGDWIHHNTYGYFDGNSLMLREWKEN